MVKYALVNFYLLEANLKDILRQKIGPNLARLLLDVYVSQYLDHVCPTVACISLYTVC